jgi:hypothetical protein
MSANSSSQRVIRIFVGVVIGIVVVTFILTVISMLLWTGGFAVGQ